ncbi:unnamed protein product (macronuclear) [Paramecium tetraurelia]|uniref:Chromosome undetermined scaffold_1, whole genome shotgun sequence n=1 Tax=Paramecium tetraurelia TaxID=5888 RepID=Q6BFJ8_PARTE|nr:hypothetical protein [Paramecium tetraurelia strain d4-2]XP_001423079.1 uncharacterized protein GSPATT00000116001 [Paramecium tetraurelia]CAH03572.1 hypothetical protein PTMB.375 [Paramecium tetraurelia]CAK55681.1 unnamed protein product [Paramecium tetraurelia]|eukprot:XP_001423079.1 hypothetical protein (macronuclear) [Paramecium tetraurelia strain d4-2]
MQINCLFCEKQRTDGKINFPFLLKTALYLKYNQNDDQPIDDVIKHSHKKWVIDFFEKAQEIKDEAFVRSYYQSNQIGSKLVDLTEYYKYRLDTPHFFMLPLSKAINQYNKIRKEYHYTQIKYQLGMLVHTKNNQNDLPFVKMLKMGETKQEDSVSKSLISLLNKIKPTQIKAKQIKQAKVYTQQSSLSTTKLNYQPLIKKSELVSRKLKAILNENGHSPVKQNNQYKKIQSKSQSNVHLNTQISMYNYKKLSVQQSMQMLMPTKSVQQSKLGSQADIISSIYLSKNSINLKSRQQKKLRNMFQK